MTRWFLVGVVGAVVAPVAAAAPVGMAVQLSGKPEVRAATGGAWKPLRLLQRLEPGDTLRCPAGSEAVVVLFDNGKRFKVGGGGQGVVEAANVKGAAALAGLRGPSIRVAKALSGASSNAFLARPAQSHQRLTKKSTGWLREGERRFVWDSAPGAAAYSFTLFDQYDNVVWSARTGTPDAEYPADLAAPGLRRPYVWRLVPFGGSGKPLQGARWGVITFLSESDVHALEAEEKELRAQADASGTDITPLVLLAELYRGYGVLERTLETLEDPRLADQPGIEEARQAAYRQISPYAVALARPAAEGENPGG